MKTTPLVESGWVLLSPAGNVVSETFGNGRWAAWCFAFDYLSDRLGDPWRSKYWKRPEPAEKAAAKLGWKMTRCIRSECVEYKIHKAKKK